LVHALVVNEFERFTGQARALGTSLFCLDAGHGARSSLLSTTLPALTSRYWHQHETRIEVMMSARIEADMPMNE